VSHAREQIPQAELNALFEQRFTDT